MYVATLLFDAFGQTVYRFSESELKRLLSLLRIGNRSPGRARIFLFITVSQTAYEAHPATCLVDTGLIPWV
jgi:hypothetical protein